MKEEMIVKIGLKEGEWALHESAGDKTVMPFSGSFVLDDEGSGNSTGGSIASTAIIGKDLEGFDTAIVPELKRLSKVIL